MNKLIILNICTLLVDVLPVLYETEQVSEVDGGLRLVFGRNLLRLPYFNKFKDKFKKFTVSKYFVLVKNLTWQP